MIVTPSRDTSPPRLPSFHVTATMVSFHSGNLLMQGHLQRLGSTIFSLSGTALKSISLSHIGHSVTRAPRNASCFVCFVLSVKHNLIVFLHCLSISCCPPGVNVFPQRSERVADLFSTESTSHFVFSALFSVKKLHFLTKFFSLSCHIHYLLQKYFKFYYQKHYITHFSKSQ